MIVELMFKLLAAFWIDVIVLVALSVGLGWWLRGVRHTRKCRGRDDWDVDDALEVWEPVFKPFERGVAKVGD